jgi:hypothetical protein
MEAEKLDIIAQVHGVVIKTLLTTANDDLPSGQPRVLVGWKVSTSGDNSDIIAATLSHRSLHTLRYMVWKRPSEISDFRLPLYLQIAEGQPESLELTPAKGRRPTDAHSALQRGYSDVLARALESRTHVNYFTIYQGASAPFNGRGGLP